MAAAPSDRCATAVMAVLKAWHESPRRSQIPRGQRFAAIIGVVLLAAVLVPSRASAQPEPAKEPDGAGGKAVADAKDDKPARRPKDECTAFTAKPPSSRKATGNSPRLMSARTAVCRCSDYRTTNTDTSTSTPASGTGGEVIFNPEVSGGRGLSNTLGMAGFPTGEATRVGALQPTPYIRSAVLPANLRPRRRRPSGSKSAPNQLAGIRDIDRITFTAGKMAATDLFDDNRYSHDPRTQFLNWSLMYNGAWDYPANVRGYTYGATIDFNTRYLAFRYGVFGEPKEANGQDIDPRASCKANGQIAGIRRAAMKIDDLPGRDSRMGLPQPRPHGQLPGGACRDAGQPGRHREHRGLPLQIRHRRQRRAGTGDQISASSCEAGWNDGQSESWAFTEIDQTVATGLNVKGALWSRPKDEAGLALVVNGLSDAHRDYLAAGGIGFIIGDGRLNYAHEADRRNVLQLVAVATGLDRLGSIFQAVNQPGLQQRSQPGGHLRH